METMPFDESQNSDDELLPEYNFKYQKAKPNRFATRLGKKRLTVGKVVTLTADQISPLEPENKLILANILN